MYQTTCPFSGDFFLVQMCQSVAMEAKMYKLLCHRPQTRLSVSFFNLYRLDNAKHDRPTLDPDFMGCEHSPTGNWNNYHFYEYSWFFMKLWYLWKRKCSFTIGGDRANDLPFNWDTNALTTWLKVWTASLPKWLVVHPWSRSIIL